MPKIKKNSAEMPETFDIKERVIFSAGVHNGDMYTEDDLAEMERAFLECKGKLRPPLKLGHSEDQSIWEKDGLPAIGWIDNVKKVGSDLVADFIKVPKVIYELLKAGAYRTVSAEIYWNAVIDGKKYPYALKALALLGADIPAVKTVSDILSLYKAEAMAYEEVDCVVKTYEGHEADKEQIMDTKEEKVEPVAAPAVEVVVEPVVEAKPEEVKTETNITEVVEKLEKIVATLSEKKAKNEAKIAELTEKLTATEKAYTEAQATIEAANVAKRYNDLEGKVDSLIGEKKLLPAQKPAIMKLLSEIPLNKTYKDGELEGTVEALIFDIFKANTSVKLNTEEQTQAGAKGNASDEVAEINKISKDKGLSYKEAYKVWKKK